jgi:hypothetical protein
VELLTQVIAQFLGKFCGARRNQIYGLRHARLRHRGIDRLCAKYRRIVPPAQKFEHGSQHFCK